MSSSKDIDGMVADAGLYCELESDIEAIETDASLIEEINYTGRVEVIDRLEFHVLDRLEITRDDDRMDELIKLKLRAGSLKERLEQINEGILQKLRDGIKYGTLTGEQFRRELAELFRDTNDSDEEYDSLDVFANGLLRLDMAPQETQPRESEMVFYQPTPAHVI